MSEIVGRYIISHRNALGISQAALAGALGTSRAIVNRWETGARRVPESMVQPLADAIHGRVEELRPLIELRLPIVSDNLPRQAMPLYPCKYNVSDVPAYIVERAGCLPAMLEEIDRSFPRDRPEELAAAFHLLRLGELCRCAPTEVGCDYLVSKPFLERAAGHLLHYAIHIKLPDRELIAFPQLTLIVPGQGREYRVDFLLLWRGVDVTVWAYLEINGDSHLDKKVADELRLRGLRHLRRMEFDPAEAYKLNFADRVLARLRKLEIDLPLPV